MPQLPESESRSPFHRASSLTDLLSWDDLDFVRCAYVTILGRQPDLPGQAQYVQQIRAGHSKLDMLWRLRRSPEAKQHDPGIAGLDRALRRAAWQRRPLLGAISRFLQYDADSPSRSDRALRALMNATSVNQRYLHALGERLVVNPALSGGHATTDATPTPGRSDQGKQSDTLSSAQVMTVVETPELDHLRQKRMSRRFIGEIAP